MKLFGAIIGTDEVVEKMPINIDVEAGNQMFLIKNPLLYGKEAEYSYQRNEYSNQRNEGPSADVKTKKSKIL